MRAPCGGDVKRRARSACFRGVVGLAVVSEETVGDHDVRGGRAVNAETLAVLNSRLGTDGGKSVGNEIAAIYVETAGGIALLHTVLPRLLYLDALHDNAAGRRRDRDKDVDRRALGKYAQRTIWVERVAVRPGVSAADRQPLGDRQLLGQRVFAGLEHDCISSDSRRDCVGKRHRRIPRNAVALGLERIGRNEKVPVDLESRLVGQPLAQGPRYSGYDESASPAVCAIVVVVDSVVDVLHQIAAGNQIVYHDRRLRWRRWSDGGGGWRIDDVDRTNDIAIGQEGGCRLVAVVGCRPGVGHHAVAVAHLVVGRAGGPLRIADVDGLTGITFTGGEKAVSQSLVAELGAVDPNARRSAVVGNREMVERTPCLAVGQGEGLAYGSSVAGTAGRHHGKALVRAVVHKHPRTTVVRNPLGVAEDVLPGRCRLRRAEPAGERYLGAVGYRLGGGGVHQVRGATRELRGREGRAPDGNGRRSGHCGGIRRVVAVGGRVVGDVAVLGEVVDGDEVGPHLGLGQRRRGGGAGGKGPQGVDLGGRGERGDANPDERLAFGIPRVDLVREERAVPQRKAQVGAVGAAIGRVKARLPGRGKAHQYREVGEGRGDLAGRRSDQHGLLVVKEH